MQVTIHEAKTQLSRLIAAAERGEEVIIARRDKPVVRLSMVEDYSGKTRIGGLRDRKFKMGANFDDPVLNTEIARTFHSPRRPPPRQAGCWTLTRCSGCCMAIPLIACSFGKPRALDWESSPWTKSSIPIKSGGSGEYFHALLHILIREIRVIRGFSRRFQNLISLMWGPS